MKWFKHETDAFTSEGVDCLMQEFGMAGYGRWNRLLEIVAFKMDETSRCHVEYSYSKWRNLLGLNKKKLNHFLTILEDKLNLNITINGQFVKIEIPNLLKKRDNYTRNVGSKDQETSKQDVDVDRDRDIKKKKPTKKKVFVAPSSDEVEAYGKEIGFKIDGEVFLAYYEATDWMRGKSKIKDWRRCVKIFEEFFYFSHCLPCALRGGG